MRRVLPWLTAVFFVGSLALAWLTLRGHAVERKLSPPPAVAADAVAQLLGAALPDAAGRMQPLAQWRGRILVVNYWATWCPPCRAEMPEFSQLQTRYAARGVQFVGIALDEADKVRDFAHESPAVYPLLVGGDGAAAISRALGNEMMGLPYTVVIDREGKLRAATLGQVDGGVLAKLLDGLI